MGALYIKDDEVRRMAEQLAQRRGLTKVAAVRLALGKDEAKRPVRAIMEEFWRTSKLKHDPSVVIDKAFYDSLNDEEDD